MSPVRWLIVLLMGLAACGCAGRGRTPNTAGAQQQPAPAALPRIPATGIVSLEYVQGEQWRIVPPAVMASPPVQQALARIAIALRAATPVPGVPTTPSGPDGLVIQPPEAIFHVNWLVGFDGGVHLNVAPNVLRCPADGTCRPDADYALLDGAPAHAPGLVNALKSITDQIPPPVTPVTVTPSSIAPGDSLTVSGTGWVGSTVTLTVQQCGTAPSKTWSLGSAPVQSGRFQWSGRLPGDVPAGACSLEASDPPYSAATGLVVQ